MRRLEQLGDPGQELLAAQEAVHGRTHVVAAAAARLLEHGVGGQRDGVRMAEQSALGQPARASSAAVKTSRRSCSFGVSCIQVVRYCPPLVHRLGAFLPDVPLGMLDFRRPYGIRRATTANCGGA